MVAVRLLFLLLMGGGMIATLIGVRAELDDFADIQIGAIVAAYYAGFLVGSRITLSQLGNVGHIRVYAGFVSAPAATIVAAGSKADPYVWMALRFAMGARFVGEYVVAESWLNELASNEIRGRILSLYNLTTVVAYGVGQFWFTRLDPHEITGFRNRVDPDLARCRPGSEDAAPPVVVEPERMTLRELFHHVLTGMLTCLMVGVTHGAFLGLGAAHADPTRVEPEPDRSSSPSPRSA